MKGTGISQEIYLNALNSFKEQMFSYMKELSTEINHNLLKITAEEIEISFHIINLEINAENNLGFASFLQQIFPGSIVYDEETEIAQGALDSAQIIIFDQPHTSQSFSLLFQRIMTSKNIVILSTLLPTLLQELIFQAFEEIYEEFAYFPKISFFQYSLDCQFQFTDTLYQVIAVTAISAEFLSQSLNVPLYRAQYYPNNVRMTLMQKQQKPSNSELKLVEFCNTCSNIAFIDIFELMLALESKKKPFVQDYFSQFKEVDNELIKQFDKIYGYKHAKIATLEEVLALIVHNYKTTDVAMNFYNIGQFNFIGQAIEVLGKNKNSNLGIVFNIIKYQKMQASYDEIFQAFIQSEGKRFHTVEDGVQELENAISTLQEYGLIELKLLSQNTVVIKKF